MTTNHQQRLDQAHAPESGAYTLLVQAQVTVLDQSGTAVPTASMAHAIRAIRGRYHDDVPLIALDHHDGRDPLFTNTPHGWLVTATRIMPIDGEELPREPDYRLRYHSYTLVDPNASGSPKTPCRPEALIAVAMKAADSSGRTVELSSQLLGFSNPILRPGDSTENETQVQDQPDSVLDALDPELFTDTSLAPTILVHPPAPLRQDNTITIPETTGVVYNAEPGDYPVAGEGVSVEAKPAQGYAFPPGVISHWDYEHHPAPAADIAGTDQVPVVGSLPGLVEDGEASHSAAELEAQASNNQAGDTGESLLSAEPSKAVVLRSVDTTPWWKRRVTLISVAAALAALMIGAVLLLLNTGAGEPPGAESDPPADTDWLSTVDTPAPAEESLTEDHSMTMWDLDAEDAEELSWYSAGVAHIDPDDNSLVLRGTLTGDEIARAELAEPVIWTNGFMVGDQPAVGARTESTFVAITSDGETQSWEIDESASLGITGSTPMLTTEDDDVYALLVGEEDPVEVAANPQYRAAAIDDDTLIQFAAGMPRVVTLPMNDNADPAELRLDSPTDGASFGRHLAVGHGLALTEWQIDSQDYLVVHDLTEEATVTAVVPSVDDAQGWSMGRGMEMAIIGPYAFDVETGELAAQSPDGDFLSALGGAAITQGSEGREFILEGESFYETSRVIGHTGSGTVIIRQPDGSVAALSEASGTV